MTCDINCECCINDICYSFFKKCEDLKIECIPSMCPHKACANKSECISVIENYQTLLFIYQIFVLTLFVFALIYLIKKICSKKDNKVTHDSSRNRYNIRKQFAKDLKSVKKLIKSKEKIN